MFILSKSAYAEKKTSRSLVLDELEVTICGSKGVLAFENKNQGTRYVTIEGTQAYSTTFLCGTCEFLFERLGPGARDVSVGGIIDVLNIGLKKIEQDDVLDGLKLLMGDGKYHVMLSQIQPVLITPGKEGDYFSEEQIETWGVDPFWGLPHNPKIKYYRLQTVTKPEEKRSFFEFLVPMFPPHWVEERVEYYKELLNDGQRSTAVALSAIDVKGPADWEGEKTITSHWCLSHYLADGHHKVYAAALTGKPITLISFIALDQCIASPENITELLSLYKLGL